MLNSSYCTQYRFQPLALTRALAVETWVFVNVNQPFPWFSHALRQRREGRRLTRIILNDTGVFNFYFIKMKGYIAKTTRSLPTDWNSRNSKVNVKVFKLFIYLIVWKHGSRGRIAKEHKFRETKYIIVSHKGKKFPPEWRLFWKKKRIF